MSRALIGRTLSCIFAGEIRPRPSLMSSWPIVCHEPRYLAVRSVFALATAIPPARVRNATQPNRVLAPPWHTLVHADLLHLRHCSQQQLRTALSGGSRQFGISQNQRRQEQHGGGKWYSGARIPETALAVGGLILGLGVSNRTSECEQAPETTSMVEQGPALKIVYPPSSSWLEDLYVDIKCCLLVSLFTMLGPLVSLGWVMLSWTQMGIFWACYLTSLILPPYFSKEFQKTSFLGGRLLKDVTKYMTPMTVIKEAELDPSVPYIFGYHPHGRGMPVGTGLMFSEVYNWFSELDRAGRCVFMAGTDLLFIVPFLGLWMRAMGAIPVNRRSIVSTLRKGDSVVIAIGGIDEVLVGTYDDKDVLFLESRKGFCKVAIETKAGLVPSFCFGENAMFEHAWPSTLNFWKWVNHNIARLGAPFPIVGRFGLPIMHRRPMTLVFGEPIYPREGETVAELHGRYVRALCSLYKRHVGDSAHPNKRLVIV